MNNNLENTICKECDGLHEVSDLGVKRDYCFPQSIYINIHEITECEYFQKLESE